MNFDAREQIEFKKNTLRKLNELNVNYKLIPGGDWDDLILYPDNYSEDGIWFCLYRFYDIGKTEVQAEDCNGSYYGKYTEEEFMKFVKDFKIFTDDN